jgi:hypothetical protein
MNTIASVKHALVRTPLAAAPRTIGYLAGLRAIFRRVPRHTYDETNAIRVLVPIHPGIPRQMATLHAWVHERSAPHAPRRVIDTDPLLPKGALRVLPTHLRTPDDSEVRLRPGLGASSLCDIRENPLMTQSGVEEFVTHPTWHAIATQDLQVPPVHDEKDQGPCPACTSASSRLTAALRAAARHLR